MDDNRLRELVKELNEGAAIMETAETEAKGLLGARKVSLAGEEIVKAGGKAKLREVYYLVDPKHQRTVEVQWSGLTDAEGLMWLP